MPSKKDFDIHIMSRIFNKAVRMHNGDKLQAREWLATQSKDFPYSPFSHCKSLEGARKVESFINKKLNP